MPQVFGKLPIHARTWLTLGAVSSVERDDRGVYCQCGDALLAVTVLTSSLIRVRLAPTGKLLPRRSWAVAKDDSDYVPVAMAVQETEAAIEIKTDQVLIHIERSPCRLVCFDQAGRPFAEDADTGIGWAENTVAGWKKMEADEHFYGFGERTGLLDKRSERKTNWTLDALDYTTVADEMYQAIPFFMALRPQVGYGIFFNTTFWSQFDMGTSKRGVWQMETHSGELDYYIVYGPTPAEILATYTQLTGRMPLPPKWSIGYHQCRWSYESASIVRKLAREFRDRRIPCDVIHLDIDYMNGYRVFTWSPKRFAEPAKLIHDLKETGFQIVTIVDPGVKYEPEADYAMFDDGLKEDYFVRKANGEIFHGYVWPDKAVFPDFLKPEVRHWWGDAHKALTDVGVAGIWNDMNEPAIVDRPFGDEGVHIWFPLDSPQGPADEQATHAEAHNLYGSGMSQACAEGLERLRPTERSFVLTRSGYAGVQRWSSVWMGDNQSWWEHLELSIPMLCNMGLSGVAFVGADIGGFAGNATAELFARWMQVGLLYPLMRAHSSMKTEQHEPWVFGEQTERICREYIELRYRLLPYLYTTFWEAATTGAPILRPLVYHYPNDPKTYALHDQVLLGGSLMAAPVYRPGVECRAVYLPEGVWYDWWTGTRYEGATHILADAPLERMPLYVKAGAVIPMQPVMQYVDERPIDELRLRVWSGDGEFTLYEDDGRSFEYREGSWATTVYRVTMEGERTTLHIQARHGNWTPPARTVIVELVGVGEQRFEDDGSDRTLTF
jgi:alpha-glucosidase